MNLKSFTLAAGILLVTNSVFAICSLDIISVESYKASALGSLGSVYVEFDSKGAQYNDEFLPEQLKVEKMPNGAIAISTKDPEELKCQSATNSGAQRSFRGHIEISGKDLAIVASMNTSGESQDMFNFHVGQVYPSVEVVFKNSKGEVVRNYSDSKIMSSPMVVLNIKSTGYNISIDPMLGTAKRTFVGSILNVPSDSYFETAVFVDIAKGCLESNPLQCSYNVLQFLQPDTNLRSLKMVVKKFEVSGERSLLTSQAAAPEAVFQNK